MAKTRPLYSPDRKISSSPIQDRFEKEFLFKSMLELELRERVGASFRAFITAVNPHYIFFRACNLLIDTLDKVERGEIRRLMIFMPPRHGKSETASRLFPAYYLYKHSRDNVGIVSYSAEIAQMMNRAAMENYEASGRKLDPDVQSTKEWQTYEGGGAWATGMGGSITGRGAHLAVIDDPIKNEEEAMSDVIREAHAEWYRSVFRTRLEPDARLVLIQTRWHQGDLAGYLLSEELSDDQEGWHILNLMALYETEYQQQFPPSCTVLPDWRTQQGEALIPERYDVEALNKIRGAVKERWFASLYQQNPVVKHGSVWRKQWFEIVDEPPKLFDEGLDWDLAFTKKQGNSASAYVRSGRDRKGDMYVLDVGWAWKEFPDLISWMKSFKAPHYVEKKASGKSAVQTLRDQDIYAEEVDVPQKLDYIGRTKLATPYAEQGRVFIVRHCADKLLEDPMQGILAFPRAPYEDVNDCLVQAINRHFVNSGPQIRALTRGE